VRTRIKESTDTQGRRPWEDGGREWSDATAAIRNDAGTPASPGGHQKLRRSKGGFSSRAFRGIVVLGKCWCHGRKTRFKFLTSRSTREEIGEMQGKKLELF